jgi:hypothetical protein
MDSLIAAAARALSKGDTMGALKLCALRDDPPALALRGIAMAQLGDHSRARALLKRAAHAFNDEGELAKARCIVAEAEVALALRELHGSPHELTRAAATLEARADRANALHARLIAVRRVLLLGRLDEAATALARLDTRGAPPALEAIAALASAEIAMRSLHSASAETFLARAQHAAQRARIPALLAEVVEARATLDRRAARRVQAGREQPLRLAEVEALLASKALVVDACRRGLRAGATWLPLTRRPVLFARARALAEAWPGDVERNALIAHAFGARRPNESHRARLRVEIGRLRKIAAPLARIEATAGGFKLVPRGEREVAVLVPPIDGEQASLLALLADGAAWSTSALAQAQDASQRTVQRALAALEREGRVRSVGRARAKRWLSAPIVGFTTVLLLPASLPPG